MPVIVKNEQAIVKDKRAKEFTIKPNGSRMFVKYDAFSYKGKIIIPDTAQRQGQTGRIVAVGPDVDPLIYWVNRRVMWATFSGVQFKFTEIDDPFVALTPDEIVGFIMEGTGELTLENISAG